MSFLTKEKPFECNPLDFKPIKTSPFFTWFLSFFELFSKTPTQKPAKSNLPLGKALGCSAVSPPIKEHCESLQPFVIPLIISFETLRFILSVTR